MKSYYYVFSASFGLPTRKHDTLQSAQTEAERLAKKHVGYQFEILKAIGVSKVHTPAITFFMDGEGLNQSTH